MGRASLLLIFCMISLGAAAHCALAPVPAAAGPVSAVATPASQSAQAATASVASQGAAFNARTPSAQQPPTSLAAGRDRTFASQSNKASVVVERLGQSSGFLIVNFTASNLFSPRIVETLSRGLPATLEYEIQLWKKRGAWFDKLVAVNALVYRIVYDPWEDGFRVVTKEGSSQAVFDVEHIEQSLCINVTGRVADVEFIEPQSTYYVVIRATLKPLSAEDVKDVETWLSDGVGTKGKGLRAIPGYLFDVIVGLSGLGDQAASGRSGFFTAAGGRVLPRNGR